MPSGLNIELLFAVPRNELFSRMSALIARSRSVSAVVGFLTEAGIALIGDALEADPNVLAALIVGATTLRACDGLDRLRSTGVPNDRLLVHLGHTRPLKSSFVKYHPMMHSKVYLFESAERSTAIIGSHNMTGFAIGGQNVEASVLIEGPNDDPLFGEIRAFIESIKLESGQYDPNMRLAYAWWFRQLFDGMKFKILFGTGEDGIEYKRNVVAIAVAADNGLPQIGDIVYLEVPVEFKVLKALGEPVHFYLLPAMPATVQDALAQLPLCAVAFQGSVAGSNKEVVREGRSDWIIRDLRNPVLERTTGTIVPTPGTTDIQAFVEIKDELRGRYEYVFDSAKKWMPVYDKSARRTVEAPPQLAKRFAQLNLIPAEHLPWFQVVGLEPAVPEGEKAPAFLETKPESGKFLVLSLGRRYLKQRRDKSGTASQRVLEISQTISVEATGAPAVEDRVQDDAQRQFVATIARVPSGVWFSVAGWAKETSHLTGKQRSLLFNVGRLVAREQAPSLKQCKYVRTLLLTAIDSGFTHVELSETLQELIRHLQEPAE